MDNDNFVPPGRVRGEYVPTTAPPSGAGRQSSHPPIPSTKKGLITHSLRAWPGNLLRDIIEHIMNIQPKPSAKPSAPEQAVDRATATGNKRTIGARGLQIVERMAADGHADASIAKSLRMHRETLRLCRRRQPEVQEALDRGRAALEDELTHILLGQAREGNTVAAIFLAKARCGWREGEVPGGMGERVNVTINLPAAMSQEAYHHMIDVTPEDVR